MHPIGVIEGQDEDHRAGEQKQSGAPVFGDEIGHRDSFQRGDLRNALHRRQKIGANPRRDLDGLRRKAPGCRRRLLRRDRIEPGQQQVAHLIVGHPRHHLAHRLAGHRLGQCGGTCGLLRPRRHDEGQHGQTGHHKREKSKISGHVQS
ncbi:MAG: hypothetical protein AB7E21_11105 [Pseudodonghicola sp.]